LPSGAVVQGARYRLNLIFDDQLTKMRAMKFADEPELSL